MTLTFKNMSPLAKMIVYPLALPGIVVMLVAALVVSVLLLPAFAVGVLDEKGTG